MAKRQLPTPDELRQLLRYEPETGKLFWRERGPEWFLHGKQGASRHCRSWNARFANREAFTATHSQGYRDGHVNSCHMLAHRVIWAIVTGAWPDHDIDHDDTDKTNNRWGNLRPATDAQNMQNKRARRDSPTGLKGVQVLPSGRFTASITSNGRRTYLGSFDRPEEAKSAYNEAALSLHGEYANLR
ncbi:HNH endonuclease [Sphingomonas aquatilis]